MLAKSSKEKLETNEHEKIEWSISYIFCPYSVGCFEVSYMTYDRVRYKSFSYPMTVGGSSAPRSKAL